MLNRGPPLVPVVGIQLATYTYPSYVSAECKDFVTRCLQIDPTSRSDAVQLSQHPWFLLQLSD